MKTQEKIQDYIDGIARQVEGAGKHKFSTCDPRLGSWDEDVWNHKDAIVSALRKRGYVVSVSINWGVTDIVTVKPIELK